jgi:Zn-dependent peptidase ImmA (M78 family)
MRWLVKYKSDIKTHEAIKPLLLRLQEKGWKVRFVKWVNKHIDGYCSVKKKEIVVCISEDREIYYPRPFEKIAWILAHEYRHAWQYENDRYTDYLLCSSDLEKTASEEDANMFADKYIKNFW